MNVIKRVKVNSLVSKVKSGDKNIHLLRNVLKIRMKLDMVVYICNDSNSRV